MIYKYGSFWHDANECMPDSNDETYYKTSEKVFALLPSDDVSHLVECVAFWHKGWWIAQKESLPLDDFNFGEDEQILEDNHFSKHVLWRPLENGDRTLPIGGTVSINSIETTTVKSSYSKENYFVSYFDFHNESLLRFSETLAVNHKGSGLYLIYNPGSGLSKIGRTRKIRSRFKALQNGAGNRLWLLCFSSHGSMERDMHHRYKRFRKEGEWFLLNHAQQINLIKYVLSNRSGSGHTLVSSETANRMGVTRDQIGRVWSD